ncbi:MAG: DUF2236 domain-containing protein [Ignavibacteriae bacterium]|nr:DUF2236 domain-containing protein [Ignavibacteriota bacterium]
MGRYDILRQIEKLDPERDNMRIMHLSFGYEFSWDSIRALEVALYRTYCAPSISALLDRTGEFKQRTQRRYDDTSLIMAEICKWGYLEGRGKEALERMNWAHGHYKIPNNDFLYVLSTFIFEPIRWIDRYGWRPTCDVEKKGYYYFWREVGKRMGMQNIPESYERFEQWKQEFEEKHFVYAETNKRIGSLTRDLFASWFPRMFTPLVRYTIYAMLDDQMLESFGFPKPLPVARTLVDASLRLRGRLVRWLPPRTTPHFFMDNRNRTYPRGYALPKLGPPKLIEKEEKFQERETPLAIHN